MEGALDTGRTDRLWPLRRLADVVPRRLLLFVPLPLMAGLWAYFALPREPDVAAVSLLGLAALLLILPARRAPLLLIPLLLLTGFAAAKLRSEWVATPVLRATVAEAQVMGHIARIDGALARRKVVLLDVTEISPLPAAERPRRLRLTLGGQQPHLSAGQLIALKARLEPLPLPVTPGGFDYGRQLYFQSVGGTGRALAPVTILPETMPGRYRLDAALEAVRQAIGSRVRAVLPGPMGAVSEALINGERADIPKRVNDSLRDSGLFHVLSISGLHMTLVAGGVFWIVRALLALVPPLALRWPVKKIAAVAALAAGLFYMLLADSGPATARSYIMIAVMFTAVLIDRPAISLRNLAIAAIILLVLQPEQALSASFQMSFMAVVGLAGFYEWWQRHQHGQEQGEPTHFTRASAALWRFLWVPAVTSLVAGLYSGVPAAFHFGRVAPWGVIANGLALPVVGVVVMPGALLATLLMPLGLESLPLLAMDRGLRLVMTISDWVAGLPGAGQVWRQPSAMAASLLALALILLALLRGRWRLAFLPVALAALIVLPLQTQPDVLVDGDARAVAFRTDQGELVPAPGQRGSFALNRWLTGNGEETTAKLAAARPGWTCTAKHCATVVKGQRLVVLRRAAEADQACPAADMVIAEFPLRGRCLGIPLRIDRFDLWANGAHSVVITPGRIHVRTARGEQGMRPWVFTPRAAAEAGAGPDASGVTAPP